MIFLYLLELKSKNSQGIVWDRCKWEKFFKKLIKNRSRNASIMHFLWSDKAGYLYIASEHIIVSYSLFITSLIQYTAKSYFLISYIIKSAFYHTYYSLYHISHLHNATQSSYIPFDDIVFSASGYLASSSALLVPFFLKLKGLWHTV